MKICRKDDWTVALGESFKDIIYEGCEERQWISKVVAPMMKEDKEREFVEFP